MLKNKIKKILSFCLTSSMLFSICTPTVYAQENIIVGDIDTTQVVVEEIPDGIEIEADEINSLETENEIIVDAPNYTYFGDDENLVIECESIEVVTDDEYVADSDELLNMYLQHKLAGDRGISLFSTNYHEAILNDLEKEVYNNFKAMIQKVAAGETSSTEIEKVLLNDYLDKFRWTQAELGLSESVYVEGETSEARKARYKKAFSAWNSKVIPNLIDKKKVYEATIADCPYESYWRGDTYALGVSASYYSEYDSALGEYVFCLDSVFYGGRLYASEDYGLDKGDGTYDPLTVDTTKTLAVKSAIDNAKAIAAEANISGKSDFEIIDFYKNKLCELTEYNQAAADSIDYYGDPWQIVYMFDGNPATKVVCEGYAKSMQYLCELTNFSDSEVVCYSVSGDMRDTKTLKGGAHMWNIIHMEDGRNYLVDVTNCDMGSVPNDSLFMAIPTGGSAASGYTFVRTFSGGSSQTFKYTYDSDTKLIYSLDELTISSIAYDDSEYFDVASGTCGDNLDWELTGRNLHGDLYTLYTLNITGTGDMYDYENNVANAAPWHSYAQYIESIIMDSSVTRIGKYAFSDCTQVKGLILPAGLKSIGEGGFNNCISIGTIVLPTGMTTIEQNAFDYCTGLKKVIIPASVTSIGDYAFIQCYGLTSAGPMGSGESVEFAWTTSIPDYFLAHSAVQKVTLPSTITSIGANAFASSSLSNINFPTGLQTIGYGAFGGSNLKTVSLPEGLLTIGEMSFSCCNYLEKIVIPQSVTTIEREAFFNSPKLKTLGPAGSSANIIYNWTTAIPDNAFFNCKLVEADIASGITQIGEKAFLGCSALESVWIPDSVTSIGSDAFKSDTKLTIIGSAGSFAKTYADANSIKFSYNKYNIVFDGNGEDSGAVASQTDLALNTAYTLNANAFTKTGYSFEKWNTKSDGSGTDYADGATIRQKYASDSDLTLYACWEADTPTVTFDVNGGNTLDANSKDVTFGQNYGTLPTPTRSNYSFEGWFTSAVGGTKVLDTTVVNKATDHTLYAHWKAEEYTVTFDANGGNCATTSMKKAYNSTYGTLPIPTREGYKFDGWFTSKVGGASVQSTTLIKGNITVYAHWTKEEPAPLPPEPPKPPKPDSTDVTEKFTDVPANKWYVKATQYVIDNNIMSGTSETTFEPDKPCTRAMMVTILYSAMGKPEVSGSVPFTDLTSNWYKTPVLWAYINKVTSGKSADTFAPNANVTRQEMAAFLYSFASFNGYDITATTDIDGYADASSVSNWALSQMKWANANKIINGKGASMLDPKGNATRAEVAQMIMSFNNKFK